MNTTDDEQALLRKIAAMPREIQPRRDLWPGVAQRIGSDSKSAKPTMRRLPGWPAAIAASVFVAFSAGMLLTRPWEVHLEANAEANTASPAPVERVDVQGAAEPAVFSQRSASESEYFAAFREFLAIRPTPGTGARTDGALAPEWIAQTRGVLQQTERELAAALSQSPDDPLLQQRMGALRAYQLEWLKQMAAAERNSRRIST